MRIIKPQQLAVIKSGYQIGQQSWLGVSVVAGCWLNTTAHFITEAQIWKAWREAPHGFPLLDAAEPKPFAEFLLAGTLFRESTAISAKASISVGPLTRHWWLESERDECGNPMPFMPCPLTHNNALASEDNPQGTAQPRLFSLVESDGLVAPTPVPHDFPLRQRWFSAVQPDMHSNDYRENIFPGMPTSLDTRYFQLAPASQQMDVAHWPRGTTVKLKGFGDQDKDVEQVFTLPDVKGRCWFQRHAAKPEALSMPLKTLWILPDSGIALMIFTGAIPLSHLLDDSITSLTAALDHEETGRLDTHFHDVIARRTDPDTSPFEFLYDPDLMPINAALDALLFNDTKPEVGKPCDPDLTRDSYVTLRQMIDKEQQTPRTPATPDLSALATQPFDTSSDTLATSSNHIGKRFDLSLQGDISSKAFSDCHFKNCEFIGGLWRELRFERCRFENCHWQQINITHSQFDKCQFTDCDAVGLTFDNVQADDMQCLSCRFEGWHSSHCQWNNLLMQKCELPEASFTEDRFIGWTLDVCALPNAMFKQTSTDRALFNQSDLKEIKADQWVLTKSSIMGSNLSGSRFLQCELNSLSYGISCNLSRSEWIECVLKKVGMANADLRNITLSYCAVEESSADRSWLQGSHFISSDMVGFRLQQAALQDTYWEKTSLQQACLYNASLMGATFLNCNLSGANLALADCNVSTRFTHCLLSSVCWLPRRAVPVIEACI
jgi:uncharacterized protein YjbI with pentapeptide repeats